MKWSKLISELKRRHVFKSTIAYLAISWVIIQIASTIFPIFNAPDYALKTLIYVLTVGLVFWIGFSWVYDFTADGIQKTDEAEPDEETVKLTNRRLNKVIGVSLGLAVLLLVVISFWAGSAWNQSPDAPQSKVVAVLPFSQDIEEEEEGYFKAGMTETLIGELSKVDQLKVINKGSTQVMTSGFEPANSLIASVLKKVDFFISGNIERELNRLNIQVELKESIDAEPIWQKNYTRDISEVRILWAEVAADLSRQMSITVKQSDAVLWSGLRPVKPEAYELYLKGRHYLNKPSPVDWQRGLVYLQEAIDKNPADPYAYAWMAEAYVSLGHGPDPPPDVFPKALEAAQRAIRLDSTLAMGWAALAHYHTYFGKDWALAEYAFNRSNSLNPNLSSNHYHRSWYLALFGKMNEAIEEHKLAQELDPFFPLNTAWLGELYRWVGLYEEGLIEADKASQMQNDLAHSMFIKGRIYLDQGRINEGLELLEEASEVFAGWKYIGYGPALLQTGNMKEGKAVLDELESLPLNGYRALCLGIMYAHLGDLDKTFEYFNYKQKHGWFPWIRVMFLPNEIKTDPRFLKLIRDMNLPDPAPLVYDPDL